MKIIHLTDLHISPDPVMNCDAVEPCIAALNHIARFHQDAERIIITGDLTDRGDAASYHKLQELLNDSGLNQDQTLRLLIGNHDNREAFQAVFPATPIDPNGFAQWSDDTSVGRFIYLDTLEPGTNKGHFCEKRTHWLESQLHRAQNDNMPVWLFMHHNPIPVHVQSSDSIGLVDGPRFRELIGRYRDTVQHIAFGHCHFTLSGSLHGIALSSNRGTARALWPSIEQPQKRFATGPFERHYNVMIVQADSTIVHTVDFERHDEIDYF